MLLKAGLACDLKSNGEEECENTAIALERVVSDLIGLTGAVTTALNNACTTIRTKITTTNKFHRQYITTTMKKRSN